MTVSLSIDESLFLFCLFCSAWSLGMLLYLYLKSSAIQVVLPILNMIHMPSLFLPVHRSCSTNPAPLYPRDRSLLSA